MGSNPVPSEPGADDLEEFLDTSGQVSFWQAGLDEIDAFFASCRTTPRPSGNQADHTPQRSKDACHVDGVRLPDSCSKKTSNLLEKSMLSAADCGQDDGGSQTPSRSQRPSRSDLGHPRLLQSSNSTAFPVSNGPGAKLAGVMPSSSNLHVKADYPTQLAIHSSTTDAAESDSKSQTGNGMESSGAPMDLDTPCSKSRILENSMATPQPTIFASGRKAQPSTSGKISLFDKMHREDSEAPSTNGKISLFDEMYREDLEAVDTRDPLEKRQVGSSPFGCTIPRDSDVSTDLFNRHSNPDLPEHESLALVAKTRQLGKRVTVNGHADRDAHAVKQAESSGVNGEAAAETPKADEKHETVEEAEEESDLAASQKGEAGQVEDSTLLDLSGTAPRVSSPADTQTEHSIPSDDEECEADDQPPPKKRKTCRKSTLLKELKALTSPGMLPGRMMRLPIRSARAAKAPQKTVSQTAAKTKSRRSSPPRTRAQQQAEPNGATAAKKRHARKG